MCNKTTEHARFGLEFEGDVQQHKGEKSAFKVRKILRLEVRTTMPPCPV